MYSQFRALTNRCINKRQLGPFPKKLTNHSLLIRHDDKTVSVPSHTHLTLRAVSAVARPSTGIGSVASAPRTVATYSASGSEPERCSSAAAVGCLSIAPSSSIASHVAAAPSCSAARHAQPRQPRLKSPMAARSRARNITNHSWRRAPPANHLQTTARLQIPVLLMPETDCSAESKYFYVFPVVSGATCRGRARGRCLLDQQQAQGLNWTLPSLF